MVIASQEQYAAARAAVQSYFTVREVWFQDGRPVFAIVPGPDDKAQFLRLRDQLAPLGMLPLLRRHDHETVVMLAPKPQNAPTRWLLPIGLFAATLVSTFAAGYLNSAGGCVPGLTSPLVGGVEFSLSLLAILVCHEMGHKIVSIRRRIDASLPYFIPMVPIPGLAIGTMGAVILTRMPAPNRDALIELGASGPIAGFLVAIPILVYGVAHSLVISHAVLVANGCHVTEIPTPRLLDLMVGWLLHPAASAEVLIHPMAFAGWVGLLVTALNLLPAGMLDGGHVTRAVFGPRLHVILSFAGVVAGFLFGYWVMSLLILLLIRRGHPGPLDDVSPVTPWHQAMAVALIGIFVLSAVPLAVLW
jgi:hypothetical protein